MSKINQLMYDGYSFETCPWCGTYVDGSNNSICPNCKCPVGKFNVFLRNLFNRSYLSYGSTYGDLRNFNLPQYIKSININNADYYHYVANTQINIIRNRYLNEIINNVKLLKKINHQFFNYKQFLYEINSHRVYILSVILSLWIFTIRSIKYINNKYYGQDFLDRPNVIDLNNNRKLFYKLYHQFYRVIKEHSGEIRFKKKFKKFECKNHHNNFCILHNKSLKDDFGHSYNTNTTTQMDIIIICNKGIFIPEIKNYKNPFYINRKGQLEFVNKGKDYEIFGHASKYSDGYPNRPNFARQVNNHNTAMYHFLINNYSDAPIHVESFLVNVNKSYNPKNYYEGHLDIFNIKECLKHISRLSSNNLLNSLEIQDIKNKIEKQSKRERQYPHLVYEGQGLCHIGSLLHYINIVLKLFLFGRKMKYKY